MSTRDKGKALRQVLLAILVLGVFLVASPVLAAVNCAAPVAGADTDGDGFTDAQECQGITLQGTNELVPNCISGQGGTAGCVNPDVKDLFVILARATGSLIPTDGLGFIASVGVRLHEVSQAQVGTSRVIAENQSAQKIAESLDPNGTDFGEMPWGTPNTSAAGTIYTARIKNFVAKNHTATDNVTITANYIKYVLAHEAGHGMNLTTTYSTTQAGYHETPPTKPTVSAPGTIMQTSVVYTGKAPTATFYVPTAWSSASTASLKLK